MRKKKRIVKISILVVVTLVLAIVVLNYAQKSSNENKQTGEESIVKNDVDLEKEKLDDEIKNTDMLISEISSKTEIILLEMTGTITLQHDKNSADTGFADWIFNSEIKFIVRYTTILSIPTEKIIISTENGQTYAKYNICDIKVKSVNINSIIPITQKGMLGKAYTPDEISALTEIAIERIKQRTENDSVMILLASKNLENYITSMAIKFSIFDIEIEEITGLY